MNFLRVSIHQAKEAGLTTRRDWVLFGSSRKEAGAKPDVTVLGGSWYHYFMRLDTSRKEAGAKLDVTMKYHAQRDRRETRRGQDRDLHSLTNKAFKPVFN